MIIGSHMSLASRKKMCLARCGRKPNLGNKHSHEARMKIASYIKTPEQRIRQATATYHIAFLRRIPGEKTYAGRPCQFCEIHFTDSHATKKFCSNTCRSQFRSLQSKHDCLD